MASMNEIVVKPIQTRRERRAFLTFPWRVYKGDPLWVPPLLPERARIIDPARGPFFENGYAEFFIAWRGGTPVGTICCAEDLAATRARGYGECMIGFFECVEDYAAAEALLAHAAAWARAHKLTALYGPYNLDRDDSRGLLVAGRDRPPAVMCGHTPPCYAKFFERFGMEPLGADGLAYAIDVYLAAPQVQRIIRLAEKIRARRNITVRGARLDDWDGEIDRILTLTNQALAHFPDFTPWPRAAIEGMVAPLRDMIDPELVLFAEIEGQPVGWFPGVPNFNEITIRLNGLRYPWDYLRLLRYSRLKPECVAIKSVLVPPEYWDTGVAVLLFAEMAKRAAAKGYQWADLSITGEDNADTYPLATRAGAKIYKRYRIYRKPLTAA
jgi:GNAT superfamily N-acetyltransferase